MTKNNNDHGDYMMILFFVCVYQRMSLISEAREKKCGERKLRRQTMTKDVIPKENDEIPHIFTL